MAIVIESSATQTNGFASQTGYSATVNPAGSNRYLVGLMGVRSPAADPPTSDERALALKRYLDRRSWILSKRQVKRRGRY